jgi:hypothetical protein
VPAAWREQLAARGVRTGRSLLHHEVAAADGTRKFLLQVRADSRHEEPSGGINGKLTSPPLSAADAGSSAVLSLFPARFVVDTQFVQLLWPTFQENGGTTRRFGFRHQMMTLSRPHPCHSGAPTLPGCAQPQD